MLGNTVAAVRPEEDGSHRSSTRIQVYGTVVDLCQIESGHRFLIRFLSVDCGHRH